jgi:splicing factor 3B subunit 1
VRKTSNAWDATPTTSSGGGLGDETPGGIGSGVKKAGSRWDATPAAAGGATPMGGSGGVTPGGSKKRSRWDETPEAGSQASLMGSATPSSLATPRGNLGMMTPSTPITSLTPEQITSLKVSQEMDERNRPLTDEELDTMFPEGYEVLPPPESYKPIRTPSRKAMSTPTPQHIDGFHMPLPDLTQKFDVPTTADDNLPQMKLDDKQFFDKLLENVDEDSLSPEEAKERKIMKLLLKVKNGTPPQRKTALRQLTDHARELGAGPLFNQILPLLMSPTLEDQERHLLVKVIDRILYKLDDLVRPYVHKILVVIEPLLIDEDYYARVEGREIISNLAKAAGLATMIATMRPDIDNVDEYVRNTTARAFAVVASALGIHSLLPFLKAVCQSKRSWQARHTGIKIVQQIAILLGCGILPHLRSLVEIIEHGM